MEVPVQIRSFALKIWIILLTFIAGFVNASAVRLFASPISHHTGNVTGIAVSVTDGAFGFTVKTAASVAAFFLGAFISGLMFYQRKFTLKKRYGIFLMFFSSGFFAVSVFTFSKITSLFILALILGMQNGMFIFYGDVLVRTTHITGYLTDAAFALAMALRGDKSKLKLAAFYLINIFCFLSGGIFSGVIKESFLLQICGIMYLFAGVYYFILRKKG
ncbi:YoaK family protein [Treponema pedis]|uniref:DUF1275 domain-containing protein n=1 Tax=Treponema pedis TaxID=409322 RepID=A0A7S6WRA0_9SPIR|nr:DUF1275 domain-containing protein [Treponema pedis]QSI04731.1 DUF1275 domain-containing protein [Treponema pedis]